MVKVIQKENPGSRTQSVHCGAGRGTQLVIWGNKKSWPQTPAIFYDYLAEFNPQIPKAKSDITASRSLSRTELALVRGSAGKS